jgi:putative Mg2+ transporter-C (MgtC) family protein
MYLLHYLKMWAYSCGLDHVQQLMASSLTVEAFVKFLLAVLLAGAVGFERQRRGEAAGLRTHILVCLGAVMLMIVSHRLAFSWAATHTQVWLDQGRIAAGIIMGVGFLGGGAILHYGREQHGLTTAALIWFVASLGVTIGAGYFTIASMATVFVLFTVIGLGRLERYLPTRHDLVLKLRVKKTGLDFDSMKQSIQSMGKVRVTISSVSCSCNVDEVDVTFSIETKTASDFDNILRQLHERFASASHLSIER